MNIQNDENMTDIKDTVKDQILHEEENANIIQALASTYLCLYLLDLQKGKYTSYTQQKELKQIIPVSGCTTKALETFASYIVMDKYSQVIRDYTNLSTLDERMRVKNQISCRFLSAHNIWCDATFIACNRDKNGTLTKVILGIRNINEQMHDELSQKEQMKQSIDANNNKTAFLQNMTHEIRTPLNAMFGFSQLLSLPDGCLTSAEKTEYFNHIHNSFNMLSMLIDDVLDLADASHGNYKTVTETVAINEVCHSAINMCEIRKQPDVEMRFTSDVDDTYTIKSDSRRIQQLLVNYLTNACKHTQQGEIHLHVSTSETPERLTFSVTDTGEGIPKSQAKEIFKRFKKLNLNSQGSGLGLNICSIIADKLGGIVKLDDSYTNGARFLFIL